MTSTTSAQTAAARWHWEPEDENDLKYQFVGEDIFTSGMGKMIATRELLIACLADAEQALGAGGVSFIPLEAPLYESVLGYGFFCLNFT